MRKLHWLSWRHIASGPVVVFHLPWQEGEKGTQMILNLVSNKSQFSMTSYKRLQLFSCIFRSVNVLDFDHNLLLRQKWGQSDNKKWKKYPLGRKHFIQYLNCREYFHRTDLRLTFTAHGTKWLLAKLNKLFRNLLRTEDIVSTRCHVVCNLKVTFLSGISVKIRPAVISTVSLFVAVWSELEVEDFW